MGRYQLNEAELRRRARAAGVATSGSAMAKAAGIHPQTLNALLTVDAREPSLHILGALVHRFGGRLEDYVIYTPDHSSC